MLTPDKKKVIKKVLGYICMPLFLACMSFIIIYMSVYSMIGDPLSYLYALKVTTQGNESVSLDTLYNIYEAPQDSDSTEADNNGNTGENTDNSDTQPNNSGNSENVGGKGDKDNENNTDKDNQNNNEKPDHGEQDNSGSSGQDIDKDNNDDDKNTNNSDSGDNNDNTGKEDDDKNDNGLSVRDIVFPGYNTKYGTFEIPKINVKYDLYFGDSYAVLDKGVGQYTGSYIPGYGGTTLLCTHNNKVRRIMELNEGDEIILTTNYGVYTYKVREMKIVHKDDKDSYSISTENNDLKFYTCYPLNKPSNATQRLFVTAELVSGTMLVK